MQPNNKVVVIPAHKPFAGNNKLSKVSKKRVCAYCRVSTNELEQLGSYDLQVEHYTQFIKNNDDWEFAGIYADYGISGTSSKNRTGFMQMIEDCRKGKIDHVITKSISRFARNTLDCLNYVRALKNLNPPVSIYFEKERIDTLDSKHELLLTILSSIAQEESRAVSENIKWSIQKQFQEGKARCPTNFLIGYKKDETGNLIIDEKEAVIVRAIYKEYISGRGAKAIANRLRASGIPSARGGSKWGKNSIFHILKNERYCGDVLMQKVITVDFLTHRKIENKGQLPQYYIKDHHPAIIQRDEWNAVQSELARRREIATQEDPKMRQGHSSISAFSNHLYCGYCGQPLIRYSTTLSKGGIKESISVWRCRATIRKSREQAGCEPCNAKRQQEMKLKESYLKMLSNLKQNRETMIVNEDNTKLLEIAGKLNNDTDFKDEYFRELVDKGIVYNDGSVEYIFKNGTSSIAYMK